METLCTKERGEQTVMEYNDKIMQKYDTSQYTPVAIEGFDFPVVAALLELSSFSMRAIQWHWHEEIEFVIVQRGLTKIQLPDKNIVLSPGDGIFLNSNVLHSIYSVGKEDSAVFTFKFHTAYLFGFGETSLFLKYVAPILSSSTMHFLVLKKDYPIMEDMLNNVNTCIHLFSEKPFGHELKIKALICNLWEHLLSFSLDTTRTVSPPDPHATLDNQRIKAAIIYIQEKYMEPITLEDIANSIHLSKSECCRCFQRSLGITAFDYLIKYRIFESTCKIIRGEEVANSISSLAASVGFNNASYYNKIFKKYLGCTPTEYKKNLQNNSQKKKEDIS